MERYIAIDNVCAWPNLTKMPDGAIVATIFNQPTHGRWEGDVECWASTDGGCTWKLRGVPAPHEPGANRMNVAAGLAHNGDLVVIASGWSDRPTRGQPGDFEKAHVLLPWVCRSSDGGRTWERAETVTMPQGVTKMVPFGDIERAPDGTLGVTFYTYVHGKNRSTPWRPDDRSTVRFLRSRDDGRTWGEAVVMGAEDYGETDILRVSERRWLAASRTARDHHLELLVSEDGGDSWSVSGPLTLPRQHPAHLLRLADGRILLVYGIRNQGLRGVGARLSPDEGQTWGDPILLVDLEGAPDLGYPSSVQLEDGTILTAYYCNGIPQHQRYHMGVVRWRAEG